MIKNRLAILALALLVLPRSAAASTIQIGSAAALGANDFFDWGQVARSMAAAARSRSRRRKT